MSWRPRPMCPEIRIDLNAAGAYPIRERCGGAACAFSAVRRISGPLVRLLICVMSNTMLAEILMTFSRHMLAAPEHKTKPLAYVSVSVFLFCIVLLCWGRPNVMAGIAAFIAVMWVVTMIERRRLKKIASDRHEENICTFARSFDCRRIDTRIIRAVYEELQKFFKGDFVVFPIRASDRIDEDLRIDREDIEDIVYDIAARAGYDMTDAINNPLIDKVNTIEDLVMFFTHQAKLTRTESPT